MRVDWLPPMHANGGLIGMSRAPGRKKGLEQRSLPADLADLHHNHRVNRIFTLLEQRELDAMECASMGPMALTRHGIQWVHFTVRDKWIPTETSAFLETAVRAIVTAVIAGERVLVHCNGGKGRTGTAVAAALLVLGAVDGLCGAIQLMRAHRPGMLRNPLQQLYIWHLVPYLVWLRHTMAVRPLHRALPGAAVVSLV
jgi:protein tyrosine phosphatase